MKKLLTLLAFPVLLIASPVFAGTYDVDVSHSHVGFSVKHMVITNVKGNFKNYTGSFEFDEKTKTFSSIHAVIQVASIDTDNVKRDNHLRDADFFDAAKFPEMTFDFKSATVDGDDIAVTGNLTIKGITKPVILKGEYSGSVKGPWGKNRVGFSATAKIKRTDFGLTWNKVLESGGLVVGDKIKILLDVEGILREEK